METNKCDLWCLQQNANQQPRVFVMNGSQTVRGTEGDRNRCWWSVLRVFSLSTVSIITTVDSINYMFEKKPFSGFLPVSHLYRVSNNCVFPFVFITV